MAEISLKTGGNLCNLYSLFDNAAPAAYVGDYVRQDGTACQAADFNKQPFCKLRNSTRAANPFETMPLFFAGSGPAAADCAAAAVGQNPYILVSELE